MALLRTIAEFLSRWLDAVAAAIVAAFGWFVSPRVVQLVDAGDGSTFTVRLAKDSGGQAERVRLADGAIVEAPAAGLLKAIRGNRVEVVLGPSRFVFRQLELPRRAIEFLDGIVRAQIDRLTPWAAGDAVFGWGRPADIANDRISILVAATARTAVAPILRALSDLGVASIAVLTAPAESPAAARIKVYDQSVRGMLDAKRVSRVLLVVLLLAGGAAGLALAADVVVGGTLEARQTDLAHRIAERRATLRTGPGTVATSAAAMLDRRKQETPATVIVLEALSEVLPDHTYVTELRVEGNKVQIVGVTQDAPGLIRMIEQSPHFTQATFFAPTTRSASDPGDRFHIEARIVPLNAPRT